MSRLRLLAIAGLMLTLPGCGDAPLSASTPAASAGPSAVGTTAPDASASVRPTPSFDVAAWQHCTSVRQAIHNGTLDQPTEMALIAEHLRYESTPDKIVTAANKNLLRAARATVDRADEPDVARYHKEMVRAARELNRVCIALGHI